jgi:hypothetical protein
MDIQHRQGYPQPSLSRHHVSSLLTALYSGAILTLKNQMILKMGMTSHNLDGGDDDDNDNDNVVT